MSWWWRLRGGHGGAGVTLEMGIVAVAMIVQHHYERGSPWKRWGWRPWWLYENAMVVMEEEMVEDVRVVTMTVEVSTREEVVDMVEVKYVRMGDTEELWIPQWRLWIPHWTLW